MPLPRPNTSAPTIPTELKTDNASDIDISQLDLKEETIPLQFREIIREYRLKKDAINKHYIFVSWKGSVQLVITAQGVDYLCREFVKSAHIIDIKPTFTSGVPMSVTVIMRVETLEGRSYDDVGCVPVKTTLEVAMKHAVTNARMRAFRAAIGFNVPDEVTASEIMREK